MPQFVGNKQTMNQNTVKNNKQKYTLFTEINKRLNPPQNMVMINDTKCKIKIHFSILCLSEVRDRKMTARMRSGNWNSNLGKISS